MSEARFDLVILRHSSAQSIDALVQALLELLDEVGNPYLEYKVSEALLFEQSSSVVLDDLSKEDGERYQQQFHDLKVETELRQTLSLVAKESEQEPEEIYTCPACEHKQPKQKEHPEGANTCAKCGVVDQKHQKKQQREEVYELEKRKLQQAQDRGLKESVERAKHNEAEALREEAREKLGIKTKDRKLTVAVSIGALCLMGVAAFFIIDTLRSNSSDEQIAQADGTEDALVDPAADGSSGPKGAALTVKPGLAPNGGTINIEAAQPQQLASLSGHAGNSSSDMDSAVLADGQGEEHNASSAKTVAGSHADAAVAAHQGSNGNGQGEAPAAKIPFAGLQALTDILNKGVKPATDFFSKINAADYAAARERIQRLLALDKPDLALVFAENSGDSYAAARLVMEIAEFEAKQRREQYHDDMLLTMKSITAQTDDKQQMPLLVSALSYVHAKTGDRDAAEALLSNGLKDLSQGAVDAEKRMVLTARMLVDQQRFGNTAGAEGIISHLQKLAENLPKETQDRQLMLARIYTHLAVTSLGQGDRADAQSWLKKIPAANARSHLLARLEQL